MAETVHREPCLAVIEAADHHVHAPEHAQSQVGVDVTVKELDSDIGVHFLDTFRGYLSLAAFAVLGAEKHRAAEVGRLDGVEIDHKQMSDTHERQVLENLVSQCPCSNDHHF